MHGGSKKTWERWALCLLLGLWISTAKKFSGSRREHPILGDLKMKSGTMVAQWCHTLRIKGSLESPRCLIYKLIIIYIDDYILNIYIYWFIGYHYCLIYVIHTGCRLHVWEDPCNTIQACRLNMSQLVVLTWDHISLGKLRHDVWTR